ncbi:hypothetical protein GWI33_017007 [Rhynchophorus ferrugineus]|uniref:Uncharacterized protein n=1 Tax=Rhynchophorus ferrugineus TaxID=354439 RepID=A0A834IA28_RHYFE|nr:hypothetical protein GWI33_017007 [Rhynchophorus ferrugineus]
MFFGPIGSGKLGEKKSEQIALWRPTNEWILKEQDRPNIIPYSARHRRHHKALYHLSVSILPYFGLTPPAIPVA